LQYIVRVQISYCAHVWIERLQFGQRRGEGRELEVTLFRGRKDHVQAVAISRPERSRQVELHAGDAAPCVLLKAREHREHRLFESELVWSDEVQRIDTVRLELFERTVARGPRKGLEDDVPHMIEMTRVLIEYLQKLARAQATDGFGA
jgi:hypothetical protein